LKKKRMIMKILKKEWFIWKFWKKGGSRERGGGGNEIHAPCACETNWNFKHLINKKSIREKVSNSIFIFRAISLTSVGKSPYFLHFLPCLHMSLSFQTVSKTLT
jgi:hypothetical protein